jgi:hypothetical protein
MTWNEAIVLTLLLNFALEYAISNIQEILEGLELSETHQLLHCTYDVNVLCVNVS